MLDFTKVIPSDSVILRPIQLGDFEAMKELTQDKAMWHYFTSDLSDVSILKNWIEKAISDLHKKEALPYTILDAKNNQVIGSTRIGNIFENHKRAEIGWTWISKAYQGTGINRHVKNLLFDYLFGETDIVRIEFKTDVLNLAARKSMEKVGLIEEGVLRSHTLMTNNRRRDTVYYSILKTEWENRNES